MTISCESIAVEILRIGAQQVADAVLAHAANCVAPKSGFAKLAVSSLGVKETLETLAGVRVAVSGVVVVPVVAAVARHARTAGNFRISVVVVGADGAT